MGLLKNLAFFLQFISLTFVHATGSGGYDCEGTTNDGSTIVSALEALRTHCHCIKPFELAYSRGRAKCVVLAGKRCNYLDMEMNVSGWAAEEVRSWTQPLDCIENSLCNAQGFCECDPEFFRMVSGECGMKPQHGKPCSIDTDCLENALLCLEGTCRCNGTEAEYYPVYGKCMGRAGSSCSKYHEYCVTGASCLGSDGVYRKKTCECKPEYILDEEGDCTGGPGEMCDPDSPCFDKLRCSRGKCACPLQTHIFSWELQDCVCKQNYFQGDNGNCFVKYNQPCEDTVPCMDGLSCFKDKCVCPFPRHQYYNDTLRKCVTYVGGPCKDNVEGLEVEYTCVPNANCEILNGFMHECKCKEGHIESESRSCKVSYGNPCKFSEECDPLSGLVCSDGTCKCPKLQGYDTETGKCEGLVGAACDLHTFNSYFSILLLQYHK